MPARALTSAGKQEQSPQAQLCQLAQQAPFNPHSALPKSVCSSLVNFTALAEMPRLITVAFCHQSIVTHTVGLEYLAQETAIVSTLMTKPRALNKKHAREVWADRRA